MHVEIDYPGADTELKILRLTRGEAIKTQAAIVDKLSQPDINQARADIMNMHVSESLETYIVQLIMATRQPSGYSDELAQWIEIGASPRATIALERCARAHAWLAGRDFVAPDDVQAVLHNVLRHRIILSYQAQAEGVNANKVLDEIVALVPTA